MRDICEKYQFILCQLFFNIDAVAQPIEIKNDTICKVQSYQHQDEISEHSPIRFPKRRHDNNLQGCFGIIPNTGTITIFHMEDITARLQIFISSKT